ncbi:Hypothetical protein PHPALM_17947 [Phytophthora palmivora]|uniref:Uncharacterized protein n=1 Tax=Phytophthora palmivora TaxID=4796 RepID=A0A2P4XKZ1_9STRA|nr:Hypothetical protein PHPALM_17947 [Phytophthora palmivora]
MSSTTQRDADGDVDMSVGQSIFEFIKDPKIEDWGQSAIVNAHRSFDVKMLEVVSLYVPQSTVEDVTEEQLVLQIHDRTQNVMNKFVTDLDGFFSKNLKIDLRAIDIDAQILTYCRDFSELIEHHEFGPMLAAGPPADSQFEDRMKPRSRIPLDNLEP